VRRGPSKASFPRFIVVGGTCTVAQYALLALMIDGFGWWPTLSSAIAYSIAVSLNYELSRRFTFFGRPRSWREYGRFVAGSLLGLSVNTALFELGMRAGLPHYLIAQTVATAAAMGVNFFVYRHWTFRD
jgi:putative flippase GtrA